ncbi:MAG: hypothetical protein Kow0042_26000 [Calditrichia bacterium]
MIKRLTFLLLGILIGFFSCDEARDILQFRKAPVIEEIILQPGIVNPFDTVYAEVKASNPEEGVLSYEWTVSPNSGSFIDPTDRASTRWIAPLQGDVYTFTVKVSNSYKTSEESKKITVLDLVNPVVDIKSPSEDSYITQFRSFKIRAEAVHKNGIKEVRLYINDAFIKYLNALSNNLYETTFTADSTYVGKTEIKVEAEANIVRTLGADSVMVNIEGILPGK